MRLLASVGPNSLGQKANVRAVPEKDSPHTPPPESAAARVSFQLGPAINRWAQRFITVGTGLQDNRPFLFSLKDFKYEALMKLFGGQVNTGSILDLLHFWQPEAELHYSDVDSLHLWATKMKDLLEWKQFIWKGSIRGSVAKTYWRFSERWRAANALKVHFLCLK